MKEFIKTILIKKYDFEADLAKDLNAIVKEILQQLNDRMNPNEREAMAEIVEWLFTPLAPTIPSLFSKLVDLNHKNFHIENSREALVTIITNYYIGHPASQADLLLLSSTSLLHMMTAELADREMVINKFLKFSRLAHRISNQGTDVNLIVRILREISAAPNKSELRSLFRNCSWSVWTELMAAIANHPNVDEESFYQLQFLQNPFLVIHPELLHMSTQQHDQQLVLYAAWLTNPALVKVRMLNMSNINQSTTYTLFQYQTENQLKIFLNSLDIVLQTEAFPEQLLIASLLGKNSLNQTPMCQVDVIKQASFFLTQFKNWLEKKYINLYVMRKLLNETAFLDHLISEAENINEEVLLQLFDLLDFALEKKCINANTLEDCLSRPLTIATGVIHGAMPKEYHSVLTSLGLNPKCHRVFVNLLQRLKKWHENKWLQENTLTSILMKQSEIVVDDEYHYPFNRLNVFHALFYECTQTIPELLF